MKFRLRAGILGRNHRWELYPMAALDWDSTGFGPSYRNGDRLHGFVVAAEGVGSWGVLQQKVHWNTVNSLTGIVVELNSTRKGNQRLAITLATTATSKERCTRTWIGSIAAGSAGGRANLEHACVSPGPETSRIRHGHHHLLARRKRQLVYCVGAFAIGIRSVRYADIPRSTKDLEGCKRCPSRSNWQHTHRSQ